MINEFVDDLRAFAGLLSRAVTRPQSQLLLWVGGLGWFGIGDSVSTLYGLSLGLTEAHPLLAPLMDTIGAVTTLMLAKLALFALTLGVWGVLMHLDRPDLAVGVPLALTVFGFVVTALNTLHILIVLG